MTSINPHFPIFVIVLAVVEQEDYIERIIPAFNRVNFQFFNSEAVVFHSYDIRKARGAFSCLVDPAIRSAFLPAVSRLMQDSRYRLISVAVKKSDYVAKRMSLALSPYTVAFQRALEYLVTVLESRGQDRIVLIAEERGKREDAELRESFHRFLTGGAPEVTLTRASAISWTLTFVPKRMNCVGHQIADLAGAPIAAHVLNMMQDRPTKSHAYHIIAGKLIGLEIVP